MAVGTIVFFLVLSAVEQDLQTTAGRPNLAREDVLSIMKK